MMRNYGDSEDVTTVALHLCTYLSLHDDSDIINDCELPQMHSLSP